MARVHRRGSDTLKILPVFKVLVGLWLATVVFGALITLWESRWGISLLWGSSVCLLPALIFAWYAAGIRGARQVGNSVRRFYLAEAAKFMVTALLFAVVFTRDATISLPVFFCAYIATQILTLVLTAMVVHRHA